MLRMSHTAIGAMAAFLASADTAPQPEPQPRRRPPTIRERMADDLTVCLPSHADAIHAAMDAATDEELADWPAVGTVEVDAEDLLTE